MLSVDLSAEVLELIGVSQGGEKGASRVNPFAIHREKDFFFSGTGFS
jgi:hypothetical protein